MNPAQLRRASMAIACVSTALFASCAPSSSSSGRGAFLEKTWASKQFEKTDVQKNYTSVYIAPVDTSRLSKQDWWQSQNSRTQSGVLEKDANKLGRQLKSSLTREIRNYPGNKLAIASSPGPHTLTIETAITELIPSKAYWNAGATAAGFVVPGAGLLSAAGSGSIAVAGRLRDNSGTVATFSDKRSDQLSPINLRSYEWYGGAENNIEIWAKKGAEFLNAKPGSTVKRTSSVTLNPF
ncbi:DUF3313 family protein [Haloferula sp. BvORR071]|uniref:DUF3313 family protein n=1 Tax=Haloferula sp. BvORR071 TaxID=1396141 RepID=UPI002240EF80|nr:DUF3313 family protein [Haloferula sp. BvORR071]